MMKKIFLILYAAVLITTSQAFCAEQTQAVSRRDCLVGHYLVKKQVQMSARENFLSQVATGNLEELGRTQDLSLLNAADKFGNNCFHLAKDAQTLQVLGRLIRRLPTQEQKKMFAQLRNQRNKMGETPVMAHVSAGKAETFFLLYKGSELETAIREAKRLDKGGALAPVARIREDSVRSLCTYLGGKTLPQVALEQVSAYPHMGRLVNLFKLEAPYLF